MIAVGLFGLAVVREVFPEARDQRHVPEAVGRRLSCLLRAHQIDRSGLAPGVLHLETGAWSRHHMVSWSGRRRVVPKCCHRNTVVTRRALLLVFFHVRILFETYLKRSDRFTLHSTNFYLLYVFMIIEKYKSKFDCYFLLNCSLLSIKLFPEIF